MRSTFFSGVSRGVVRTLVAAGLAVSVLAGSGAMADGVIPDRIDPATRAVLDRYPGLQAYTHDGRVIAFYGKPMTIAAGSNAAASGWIAQNGEGFGVGKLDLRLERVSDLDFGKFESFAYKQYIDGLPVEYGMARILVLNTGQEHKVAYAAAKLAKVPDGGFRADQITGGEALAKVRAMRPFADLTMFSEPSKVVYYGEGDFEQWVTASRAWKFVGDTGEGPQQRKFTFFVDASTGDLLAARNEILHIDVTGTVSAWATPSPLGNAAADHAGNPPALRTVPNIKVRLLSAPGGTELANAYTDANGLFTIPWAGTTPVTLEASVGDGRWARVVDQAGLPLRSVTVSATPGLAASLVLNETDRTEQTNAQVNAFIHQTTTHNYFLNYLPTQTNLNTQMPANTQVSGTCNAFYNGNSTNFYNSGGGCNNTAFSSVVAHEYGHHIVNRLGLAQGAFGEGFGDTISMLQYDDPVVGRFFSTSGGAVRTPDSSNRPYPCPGTAVHFCGEQLGGVVWEIRKAYVNFYGLNTGRELVRQQHANWADITLGGQGVNSAHPLTSIEWLTVDDNDADLTNQTPNYSRICSSFAMHTITCPTLTFSFPNGLPEFITPGVQTQVRVDITQVTQRIQSGTPVVLTSINGAPYQTTPLTLIGNVGNVYQYNATLPAALCGQIVRYGFRASQQTGGNVSEPSNFPTSFYTVEPGNVDTLFSDDFEIDRGWTTSSQQAPGATGAVTGLWERVDPVPTAAQPGDDHTPPPGVRCYVTGQHTSGQGDGFNDVDNGYVTLTSPAFSALGDGDFRVTYWRWYNNSASTSAPGADIFVVEISDDNGGTWRNLETIGPATQNAGGWLYSEIPLSSVAGLTRTAQMRVRFTASDLDAASLVEAAVDDFALRRISCANPCVADVDNGSGTGTPDGGVTIEDLLYYLSRFDAGDIRADVDNGSGTGTPDGGVTIDDLLYFLFRFDAGC